MKLSDLLKGLKFWETLGSMEGSEVMVVLLAFVAGILAAIAGILLLRRLGVESLQFRLGEVQKRLNASEAENERLKRRESILAEIEHNFKRMGVSTFRGTFFVDGKTVNSTPVHVLIEKLGSLLGVTFKEERIP